VTLLLRGRGDEEKGREEREGKGRRRKGEGTATISQIPGSAPEYYGVVAS